MSAIIDTLRYLWDTRADEIEQWLGEQRRAWPPYLYNSVDLRHSGHRLVPVDTNLYPAGFHNLSSAGRRRAVHAISALMEERHSKARRILIVPENHTRNLAYLDNLAVLKQLFTQAGLEVEIGSVAAEPGAPLTLTSASGEEVVEKPLLRKGARVLTEDGFDADLIVLNNDCTAGPIALLEGLQQPVLPPMEMGWYHRRKSVHFASYAKLATAFADHFGLDPWLISAQFHHAGEIDFKQRQGLDEVARAVDAIIERARARHAEYGIAEDPYVFVKADSGTYGMGIMNVRSGEEMLELNKKERNKMQVIKEGAVVSDVIIQEGVPTIDRIHEKAAEPMVYLIDGLPVGGMYRVNAGRDKFSNLNATGMEFTGMCDEAEENQGCRHKIKDCDFRAFGLIAVLAALAVKGEEYAQTPKIIKTSRAV